jgi:hypothetical protein
MAEGAEDWPTLEEWLAAGHDLQDLPMRPDGKRLRELTNEEARERVLAYLDESARERAARRSFARRDAGGRLSDRERGIARGAFTHRVRRMES